MRTLIVTMAVIIGLASVLFAGASVTHLSEDQLLRPMNIVDGQFGHDLGAWGRRAAAGYNEHNAVLFFHWHTGARIWTQVVGVGTGTDGSGVALDEESIIYGLDSGAGVRLFDDDTGNSTSFVGIPIACTPTKVAISFRHAALTCPGDAVRTFHYNRFLGTWESVGIEVGSVVALSGNVMAVGVPAVGTSGTGAVFIYHYFDDEWNFVQMISGQDSGEEFGASLALDGSWLAVGAPAEDTSFPQTLATDIGGVHLFKWGPTQFNPTATFYGKRDFDRFGTSVDLQGGTLAVGSPFEDIEAGPLFFPNVGAAYVYWRSGDLWNPAARLRASFWSAHDNLGFSVAISGQGVLAGAPFVEGPGNEHDAGAVYFWSRTISIFADGFESGDVSWWSASSL